MSRRTSKYRKLINSQRWVKLRAKKVAASPLCEDCLERDISTPVEEVHHIQPIESAPDFETMKILAYDIKNLKSLCRECHKKAHKQLVVESSPPESMRRECHKKAHKQLGSNSVAEIQSRNKKKTKNFIDRFLKNK